MGAKSWASLLPLSMLVSVLIAVAAATVGVRALAVRRTPVAVGSVAVVVVVAEDVRDRDPVTRVDSSDGDRRRTLNWSRC